MPKKQEFKSKLTDERIEKFRKELNGRSLNEQVQRELFNACADTNERRALRTYLAVMQGVSPSDILHDKDLQPQTSTVFNEERVMA